MIGSVGDVRNSTENDGFSGESSINNGRIIQHSKQLV
jgi:hypothetical protein